MKHKFERGQRVRLLEASDGMPPEGATGTVDSARIGIENQMLFITWDAPYENVCKGGFYGFRFELINDTKPAALEQGEMYHWAVDIALSSSNKDAATHNRLSAAVYDIDALLTTEQIKKWRDACLGARSAHDVFKSGSAEMEAVVRLYNVLYRAQASIETKREAGNKYLTTLRIACWLAYEQHTERKLESTKTIELFLHEIPEEGTTAMNPVSVHTVTYINAPGLVGVDVRQLTPDALGNALKQIQKEIDDLNALPAKPLSIQARIDHLRDGMAAVIKAADEQFLSTLPPVK